MTIKVEEKDIVTNLKIRYFTVFVNDIKLGISCNILVSMFDNDMNVVKQQNILLQDEDYQKWGSDDNYIINYVMEKYEFIKDNTPEISLVAMGKALVEIPDLLAEYI